MNPYLQIAKDHLSLEDLQALIAEKADKPKTMSYEQQRTAYYAEEFKKLSRTQVRSQNGKRKMVS